MDTDRFDTWTLSLSNRLSRRSIVGAVGLGALGFSSLAEAKKRKHKNKKKVKFNDFGCVSVGGFCKTSAQCCSGICQGKKGKKRCKSHDAANCLPGQSYPVCGGMDATCTTSTGITGSCLTTTGQGGYCTAGANCFPCQKDADCVPYCGAQAACTVCPFCANGDTICAGPAFDGCTLPP